MRIFGFFGKVMFLLILISKLGMEMFIFRDREVMICWISLFVIIFMGIVWFKVIKRDMIFIGIGGDDVLFV